MAHEAHGGGSASDRPLNSHKYLILFPIQGAHGRTLRRHMDWLASYTKLPPPYETLPPHVTFHKPITGMGEAEVCKLVESMALQSRRTRIKLGEHPYPFGKHYVVLPIHSTNALAALWTGITQLLSQVPTYEHDPYAHDNTLHVTLAAKTTEVFDSFWLDVRDRHMKAPEVLLTRIEVHRKPVSGGRWERIRRFNIPD